MDIMLIMVIILISFILLVFIISVINSKQDYNNEQLEEEEEKLLNSIEVLTVQLSELRQATDNATINKSVNMNNATINVLDIYETSNIRIPLDIIEELSYINLYDEKEVFDYIENQRNYWKLENTKKPFKKVK